MVFVRCLSLLSFCHVLFGNILFFYITSTFEGLLLIRTQCPDTFTKESLWTRSNWVARKDYIPHRLLLQRARKTTIFVVPTANQRDSLGSFAATASSTKLGEEGGKKKKARRIHSCQPRPSPPVTPAPLPLDSPGAVSRVLSRKAAATRVPASRRLQAPPRAETGSPPEATHSPQF